MSRRCTRTIIACYALPYLPTGRTFQLPSTRPRRPYAISSCRLTVAHTWLGTTRLSLRRGPPHVLTSPKLVGSELGSGRSQAKRRLNQPGTPPGGGANCTPPRILTALMEGHGPP